jgi:uncharacterized protein YllA (UPF0747 family)
MTGRICQPEFRFQIKRYWKKLKEERRANMKDFEIHARNTILPMNTSQKISLRVLKCLNICALN